MDVSEEELARVDRWWRAANYCAVGQIYLCANPLLREPLAPAHVKRMLLGHWGTTPGQNFILAHLNRLIRQHDLEMVYLSGPGHGGPAVVANAYLEGTYSEIHGEVSQDEAGLARLFAQFSFPGGIPSHASPECPGSIHEGGELGYSLAHAFGAAFDNPRLIAACVIGDGEAETGPLAASWHSTKFLNPVHDGTVLPILHLNGYKISNPTVLARIPREELDSLLRGCGWQPRFISGDDPALLHRQMADALEEILADIRRLRAEAAASATPVRPVWPMLVLETPKGWTGPQGDGVHRIEGTFRSHQVPLKTARSDPRQLAALERWLRSYRPEELFDENGSLRPDIQALAPVGARRLGANPHANGGILLRPLALPLIDAHAVDVRSPGAIDAESTARLGSWLAAVIEANAERRNFRIVGPDETVSNRLTAVFDVTRRQWLAERRAEDEFLAPEGRVLEVLSEHLCQGWLEGYLLTGRHGLFNCYEAFIHIVDSMFNQHAKWLEVCARLPWRQPIASLNYLLTSHVWRQDHNGFTHQDPGFLDVVLNKKASVVRAWLPPDANCLLVVMERCLRSRNTVNVVIAGKHPAPQWLDLPRAIDHCARGVGIWDWASNDAGAEPDVVMACAGDVPTLETLAAVSILKASLPELRIRVVNIVDLARLQADVHNPHGLDDADFDALFTRGSPVIFAFHGYPWLIHRLTYRRTNHGNFHVRGYKEEGTVTTPFDMTVLNDIDRFHLVQDVLDRVPRLGARADHLRQRMQDLLIEHRNYIQLNGEDMPLVRDWRWPGAAA